MNRSVVWSADSEKKFLELWHDILVTSDKKMTLFSRAQKVSVVTPKLNEYLKEIGATEVYTEANVSHKVDNTRTKGRRIYKNYLKRKTGWKVGEADGVDLEAAFAYWSNFRTYHERFSELPTWGPDKYESQCSSSGETVSALDLTPPKLAASFVPSSPSSSRSALSDDDSDSDDSITGTYSGYSDSDSDSGSDISPPAKRPCPTVQPATGEQDDSDCLEGLIRQQFLTQAYSPSPAATASSAPPSSAKTSVQPTKSQRKSEARKTFLRELKDMRSELQRNRFAHEHRMQRQWADSDSDSGSDISPPAKRPCPTVQPATGEQDDSDCLEGLIRQQLLTQAYSPSPAATASSAPPSSAKTSVQPTKSQRKSEARKTFLRELKDMKSELQRNRFAHEHRMQRQWAELLAKRDEERDRRERERRRAQLAAVMALEQQWQRHAQALQQNHAQFMCMLLEKHGL